ncbi:hypothetical protein ABTX35_29390 [Streptomyces sp. NPDC096080]|uniref:hypothetical protein n=1 Tax=Streptomyces sp. NPDC096080 TaxID=3156693 RepID=UPI003327B2E3
MADLGQHARGDQPAPQDSTPPALRKGGARVWLWRWVLAPRTTWESRRLAASLGPGTDAEVAWMLARLARHPDEVVHLGPRLEVPGHTDGTNSVYLLPDSGHAYLQSKREFHRGAEDIGAVSAPGSEVA